MSAPEKRSPKDRGDPMGCFLLIVLLILLGSVVLFVARWLQTLFDTAG